jgi:phthiodiolone/phenolphthiodiolone dimycocerosates ketoreductase
MVQGIAVGLELPALPPLRLRQATVLFARLMRLDSVLVPDHLQNFVPNAIWNRDLVEVADLVSNPHAWYDYQVLLGNIASSAGRLRIGVGVTEPIRHHPVSIAQTFLTLAHMTKRAPVLGLGAGLRLNLDPYGMDFTEPIGRLEEALKIVRLCFLQQGPIDFQGKHFHLDGAVVGLGPPKGKTPRIWIAGNGPRMLRLTGQYGDGWYPALITCPEEYAASLKIVHAAAQNAGRNPAAITPALWQPVMVAPTEQEAQAMLDTIAGRNSALVFASAEEWRKAGAEHPFGEHYRGPLDFLPELYDAETYTEALAAVPPPLLGYGHLVGTPEQIASKLREFGQAGLRHVVFDFLSMNMLSRRFAIYGFVAASKIARLLRDQAGREARQVSRSSAGFREAGRCIRD